MKKNTPPHGVWKFIANNRLSIRMIAYLFTFSLLITALFSGYKMDTTYKSEVSAVKQHINEIKTTQLAILAKNLWNYNEETIDIQLRSMVQYPDIIFTCLEDNNHHRYSTGNIAAAAPASLLRHRFMVNYHNRGKAVALGTLEVVATTEFIANKLKAQISTILLIEFIKIFFINLFIFLLFYSLVSRRLRKILKFTKRIDYANLDKSLMLYKNDHNSNDELDHIAQAINEMQQRLNEQLTQTRLLAKVFENTREGICVTKKNGDIVAVNNAFEHITGYSEAEALGQNPQILKSGKQDKTFYQQMWHKLTESGQWHGELWNKRKNGELYPQLTTISAIKDPEGSTTNYVSVFSDISKIKETMAQLEHLAHHHPLTNLPNRLLLQARLDHTVQQVRRDHGHGAVLFLDLDNFKKINDSLGHDAGDEVLKTVAKRLKTICRETDTVAHLGGDEFVVVLSYIHDVAQATAKAQQMIEELSQPYAVFNFEIHVGVSIGIVYFNADYNEPKSLLKKADAAMYEAKRLGKGGHYLYSSNLTEQALNKIVLEAQMRHGLEREEFIVHYQPQVLLSDNKKIVSCEALVRWNNPVHGLLMPDQFIPLGEESGLILPLGEWVMRTACEQFVCWQEMGLEIERVAVNLSGKQIHAKDIPGTVARILQETNCPATALELEITEGFIMTNPQYSIRVIEQIKALGVTLSVDDFGTGHSSLRYLQQLPVHRLKIDKSFVWNIHDDKEGEAIVLAVIALGHSVGLQVIAEGVETEEQNDFLLQHGCDEGQGYLYSRPVAAEQMTELLQRTRQTGSS